VVIGEDVTGGIDQKATSEYVYVHGRAIAFTGDNGISAVIGDRMAIRVNTGKLKLSATLLVFETQNRVDKANAV